MIKIRLSRRGNKNHPFYLVVVSDCRNPRDGRFIEKVGFLNPFLKDVSRSVFLHYKRIEYWINCGAKVSKRVLNLIKNFKN
ncbi:30S ribosomal protein S16 [Candidatus Westeberhardia cardiocondylae]|uniref:Small ribosomal subunit protein bS16 n=1 Tax=Candidatus Westeberhardia cardiocondylae TaxID=1594731 RepID=A0A0H5C5N7_9ENTR|nr:30S ribosomal protein S16 [Candidatus Westeberhardia cardiocondylae]MCR3756285.1 30S ribosomal subunit protein S16 [Candidatus Westeberhardia cardiocondylae]CEN32276.1 30S ribosomal protein S16 [Candidatus Westeberhardia cardiocondylae]